MRRPTALVLGTILGSTLMVGARLGTRPIDTETVVTGPPADPTGEGNGVPTGAPSASPGVAGTPQAAPTAGPTAAAPAPPSTVRQTTGPTPPDGPGLDSGTFAGGAVTHKYGTLQVTITVSGGRITSIVESYKTSLQVSAKINADALPRLRQEALTAQSADIDTVSGATYTSDAYRVSLQSALDKAKG